MSVAQLAAQMDAQLAWNDEMIYAVNTSFLILMGIIVFAMQIGFAMLEVGTVRPVDATNILFKNMLDAGVSAIMWFFWGFAFAYGDTDPTNGFIGNRGFFLSQFPRPPNDMALWFFSWTFAGVSSTIVSGSVAERLKFHIYLVWVAIFSGWVYPVVAHWNWSPQGWLAAYNAPNGLWSVGSTDLAGCLVVHTTGGTCALVAAICVGYRGQFLTKKELEKNPPRFEKVDGKWRVNTLESYNESLCTMGTLMLWFGWYGFNVGSIGGIWGTGHQDLAGRVAVNTTLCPAAASIAAILVGYWSSWFEYKAGKCAAPSWSLNDAMNGVLAGLVGITSGAGTIQPWAAVVTGITAAILYKFTAQLMLLLRVDDPVDAVAVHLTCGVWGTTATGLFADKDLIITNYGGDGAHYGLLMGGGPRRIIVNLVAEVVVVLWCGLWAGLFFGTAVLVDHLVYKKWKYPLFIIRAPGGEGIGFAGATEKHSVGSAFAMPMHDMLQNPELDDFEDNTTTIRGMSDVGGAEDPPPSGNFTMHSPRKGKPADDESSSSDSDADKKKKKDSSDEEDYY